MKFNKKFFLFIFFTFLFCLFAVQAEAKQVKAPTILETGAQRAIDIPNQFYLKGLTPANTEVLIYIDGTYTDLAKIGEKNIETNSFYYEHATVLSEGKYTVMAIAKDKTSLVLSPPTEIEFIISPLPAPTLLEINKIGQGLVIKGLTVSDSLVNFYIDSDYYGQTKVLKHESGTAGFIYIPDFKITSGDHKVWVIAEDEQGRKSIQSNVLTLNVTEDKEQDPSIGPGRAGEEDGIEEKDATGAVLATPVPILFAPVVNNKSSYDQPFIVGLARNNLAVKIYIDEELIGYLKVKNHESGTANFAFQPMKALDRGQYSISAIAVDLRGKESKLSNIINFTVKQPTIAQSAQEVKQDAVVEIKEPVAVEPESPIIVFPEVGEDIVELPVQSEISLDDKASEGSIDEEIEQIINESVIGQTDQTGSVDESQKGQGRLSLNLVIFLVFLLGVIAWIFWVNKELIKERHKTLDDQESEKLNKNNQDNSDKLF